MEDCLGDGTLLKQTGTKYLQTKYPTKNYTKELSKFNNKKSSSSVKNGMIRHFAEEDRPQQLGT